MMTAAADWPSVTPGLGLYAILIAALAAYASLDIAKRVEAAHPAQSVRWLLASAIGLGTGLWSVHLIGLSALSMPALSGHHAAGVFAGWLLAVAVSFAGFNWAGNPAVTARRALCGAAAFGLGVVVTHGVLLWSVAIVGAIEWHPARVALAAAVAVIGAMLAFALFLQTRTRRRRSSSWQMLAALSLALSLLGGAYLVFAAAGLEAHTALASGGSVSSNTLTIGASVVSLALLMAMLVWSLLETQMSESLRRTKNELQRQAFIDPLTKLSNRQLFESALARSARQADEKGSRLALLFIDLDGFKPINESFGHRSGDRMLREIAGRLRAASPMAETIARLGADEFLILLANDPTDDEVAQLSTTLLRELSQPCKVDSREASVSCSIGIAVYPEHGAMSTLIAHADAAMRAAKATGGATYCFFEARMMSGAREQVELLRDLRRALAQRELELYYQPKIHAPSGEITGVEALMRWHHPQRGMISPGVFIPIAERFGLIHSLGNWLIDEACRQARAWREEGLRMRVAINLSVYQLRQADLAERISAALTRHQINPKLLTCEITESVTMDDAQATMKVFEELARVGVHISIDDFGTGYSSLAYLRKLPAEELKIDRSFVFDLETSADARAVVDAVVKLAQALGLKVVAEGVETEAQGRILASLGCDELQGFLYARPMSAKALSQWAANAEDSRPLDFRPSLFGETIVQEI